MALMTASKHIPEFVVHSLLKSPTVTIRDTYCQGSCRDRSAEECTTTTQLIFPYRGVYVRHVGQDQTVAEANQVLFFNANEGYRVSHPVAGGDGSLTLVIEESQLEELAPVDILYRRSASDWLDRSCTPPAVYIFAFEGPKPS